MTKISCELCVWHKICVVSGPVIKHCGNENFVTEDMLNKVKALKAMTIRARDNVRWLVSKTHQANTFRKLGDMTLHGEVFWNNMFIEYRTALIRAVRVWKG